MRNKDGKVVLKSTLCVKCGKPTNSVVFFFCDTCWHSAGKEKRNSAFYLDSEIEE